MRRPLVASVLLALLAAACGGAAAHDRRAQAGSGLGHAHGPGGSHAAARGSTPPSTGRTGTSAKQQGGSAPPPSPGFIAFSPPPSAAANPDGAGGTPKNVPVSASVSPACVRPGGVATITVHTEPGALVAYDAVYSDGKNGAPPPYGAGYGGNTYGTADPNGEYTSAWTVSLNAPAGKGYVRVIAGWNGAFGQTRTPFAVADATGAC